ncbi:MAG: YdcH family protein [Kaistella sp.]
MTSQRLLRKFFPQQYQIEELKKSNPRFKRIYNEYETLSDELWEMENCNSSGITDDFMDSMKMQTEYLEDAIDQWLLEVPVFSGGTF